MVGVYYFLSFFLMNARKAPPRNKPLSAPAKNTMKTHETKTVEEWAAIIKEREDNRLRANRANDRVLAYQEEN